MKIVKATLPPDSLIVTALPRIDYQDSHLGEIHAPGVLTPEDVFKSFFLTAPKWVSGMLELRNRITRKMGLKAPAKGREEMLRDIKVEVGQAVGLFHVFAKSDREILAGENDRHLEKDLRILVRHR